MDRIDDAGEYLEAAPLNAYNAASEIEIQANARLLANMRREPGGGRMEQILWAASGSEPPEPCSTQRTACSTWSARRARAVFENTAIAHAPVAGRQQVP